MGSRGGWEGWEVVRGGWGGVGWGGVGWGGGWASRRGGCRLLAAIPMVNKPTRPPTALPLPTVLPVLPADQARRVPHPRQRLPPRQLRRVRPHERQSGVCQGTRGWPPPLLGLRQRRPLRAAAALAGGQAPEQANYFIASLHRRRWNGRRQTTAPHPACSCPLPLNCTAWPTRGIQILQLPCRQQISSVASSLCMCAYQSVP